VGVHTSNTKGGHDGTDLVFPGKQRRIRIGKSRVKA
jgi:hypothetical protein